MEKSNFRKLGTDSIFVLDEKECVVESRKGAYMVYYEAENRLNQKSIFEGDFQIALDENRIKILSF